MWSSLGTISVGLFWRPESSFKGFKMHLKQHFCRTYLKCLSNKLFPQLSVCVCEHVLKCLSSRPPSLLNQRSGSTSIICWMKDNFIENNTWREAISGRAHRLQTRVGRRIWFNGRLSHWIVKERKKRFVSLLGSFSIAGGQLGKQMYWSILLS